MTALSKLAVSDEGEPIAVVCLSDGMERMEFAYGGVPVVLHRAAADSRENGPEDGQAMQE